MIALDRRGSGFRVVMDGAEVGLLQPCTPARPGSMRVAYERWELAEVRRGRRDYLLAALDGQVRLTARRARWAPHWWLLLDDLDLEVCPARPGSRRFDVRYRDRVMARSVSAVGARPVAVDLPLTMPLAHQFFVLCLLLEGRQTREVRPSG